MEYIQRKTLLYKTDVEYGDFTINHVLGCSHGCNYPCYAFMLAKRFGKVRTYENWCEPKLVVNALDLLDKEIPKLINKIRSVHLCFTTDPFMYKYDEISNLSLDIIKKLNSFGIECTTLTKGILPEKLQDLGKMNDYGITLISLDENFRQKYEPGASPYVDRINSLQRIHNAGAKTWVSIEPYPTPNIIEQDLNRILESISFVDKIIFGRLNYNPVVTKYKNYKEYYNKLSLDVINFCTSHNIDYHIKNGTQT
jgi:DNA repair photolyase